jgi:Na+-driven multidrug efflux pump
MHVPRTNFHPGALVAATLLLSNWMICTAVLAGSQSSAKGILAETCGAKISVAADDAVATFAVFLWILYGAFGVLLMASRRQILGHESKSKVN